MHEVDRQHEESRWRVMVAQARERVLEWEFANEKWRVFESEIWNQSRTKWKGNGRMVEGRR